MYPKSPDAFHCEVLAGLSENKIIYQSTSEQGPFPVYEIPAGIRIQLISIRAFQAATLPFTFFVEQQDQSKDTLINIWEDQWLHHQPLILSRLQVITGKAKTIFARCTSVVRLNASQSARFLEEHHLGGFVKAKVHIGLSYHERIRAVASFGKMVPIKRNDNTFHSRELIRYCSTRGTVVTGGLSRLLSAFIKSEHPDDIFTSVDRQWGEGSSFEKLGFTSINTTPPYVFWVDPDGCRHYPYRLLSQGKAHRHDATHYVNMPAAYHNKGYVPIVNAGNRQWLKVINKNV